MREARGIPWTGRHRSKRRPDQIRVSESWHEDGARKRQTYVIQAGHYVVRLTTKGLRSLSEDYRIHPRIPMALRVSRGTP